MVDFQLYIYPYLDPKTLEKMNVLATLIEYGFFISPEKVFGVQGSQCNGRQIYPVMAMSSLKLGEIQNPVPDE